MKPLCSISLQYRRCLNSQLDVVARVMLGMFKGRCHGSPAGNSPSPGTRMGAIASSMALGVFQAIFFAKEPLGHLEKTTPEAEISPWP